jgi:hypothetical protein
MKNQEEQAMMKMQVQYEQSVMEMRRQLMDLYRAH